MKFVIALVIIIGLSLGAWQIYQYWGKFKAPAEETAPSVPAQIPGDQLPGLPDALRPSLDQAEQHGADGLRDFLSHYAQQVKDPRLASIQLDYVVLEGQSDPGEARRVFDKVESRLQADSPVYPRMKQLEKTYGQ